MSGPDPYFNELKELIKRSEEKMKNYIDKIGRIVAVAKGIAEAINDVDDKDIRVTMVHEVILTICGQTDIPAITLLGTIEYIKLQLAGAIWSVQSTVHHIISSSIMVKNEQNKQNNISM